MPTNSDSTGDVVPVTLNLHLTELCNYRCRFCWATFRDVPGSLKRDGWIDLIGHVAANRRLFEKFEIDKITFAGGEPTLLRFLPDLIRAAKEAGFTTCVVTNSTGLNDRFLAAAGRWMDWVTFSIESASEATNAAMGRGAGRHIESVVAAVARLRGYPNIRIRVNSVVTAANHAEDLSSVIGRISPARWKVLQGTRIAGQNDGAGSLLDVTKEQFDAFLERHRHLNPVVEDTGSILGSYLMVDPLGRAFGNATGTHVYGEPILSVGIEGSVAQIGWVPERFLARGGVWDWRLPEAAAISTRK